MSEKSPGERDPRGKMESNKKRVLVLERLQIPPPPPSTSASATTDTPGVEGGEYDFSDVFGTDPAGPTPLSSSSTTRHHYPEIIHARSHSLVGPSPRFPPSSSFFSYEEEMGSDNEEEEEKEKMGPSDFQILRVLGQGAFGKVFLVRKKKKKKEEVEGGGEEEEGEVFAMKVMRKETIIKRNQVEYMRAERDILTKITHPFIVQLRYSFQTRSKLYLILDFINGGHLFFQLYRQGIFSEDQARVYTAEIVSAVSHLHNNGIVHRDLKPENILMDADGHVMLTDFGLAKEINESSRSNSLCGTTEYMAPEILLSKGHNKDADWWSVGILLFEMLTGQPPFTHSNRQKLQRRIVNDRVKLPSYLSSNAHSLLKAFLQKDPSRRLGSGPNGGDEIKKHKWFGQMDWKKLEKRELQPQFIPNVSGRECTANFDRCWTSIPPHDSPAPTPTTGEHFPGYSYNAPNLWPNG